MDRRRKVELFEQIGREYSHGVGTIQGVAKRFGVHRRICLYPKSVAWQRALFYRGCGSLAVNIQPEMELSASESPWAATSGSAW